MGTKSFRSKIGGALGDVPFEPGDILDVPDGKAAEWLAAGLIEVLAVSTANVKSKLTTAEATGMTEEAPSGTDV